MYDDNDNSKVILNSSSSSSWRINFGGNICGWYGKENPQLVCVHGLQSEAASTVSYPILLNNNNNNDNNNHNNNNNNNNKITITITILRLVLGVVLMGMSSLQPFRGDGRYSNQERSSRYKSSLLFGMCHLGTSSTSQGIGSWILVSSFVYE